MRGVVFKKISVKYRYMLTSLNFATQNKGKLKEAGEILGIEIIPMKIENLPEIQTNDPLECVKKKAVSAFEIIKQPILVDDTCLVFSALNGLPGVFMDYFMDALGNKGLLNLLRNEENRNAIAQTSLCYYDGKEAIVVFGKIEGSIALSERGENGFGWDTIFIPKGFSKTFAEMTAEEKNNISMRKLAFENLKKELNK